MTNIKMCDGCYGTSPVLGEKAFSLHQDGRLVGDFHDDRCLARFVSEDMMAAKGEKQAASDHSGEIPKVNKTNIKRALQGLTEGSDTGLDVAAKLGKQGVKGVCANVGLCPIAMYLTAYFRRHAYVGERWIGVSGKKLNIRPAQLEEVEHPEDTMANGDSRFVWVETPKVLAEFIRNFDNSGDGKYEDEVYCKLEANDEDKHEKAWKKLVA